ncbi:MAG: glycosyltransferase family 2 protein [Blautia sp.]|nr:glycosyltransferase family 2 protein [Blautia sp.]
MQQVSVIIPNYNGKKYLESLMEALSVQTCRHFEVIVVDNGSTDGSAAFLYEQYPETRVLCFPENLGFARAVNEGIRASSLPYVLLLNNDTVPDREFVREMLQAIRRHKKAFSCQARMMQLHAPELLDDAGDCYSALGWAFARGKGKKADRYMEEQRIFSSCAGAAIYRRKLFSRTGLFDEEHFAYLEDLDIGYRARLLGYENWYAPKAVVLHVGSGTSGSRYNQFKTRYSSRNNVYLIYKNMPAAQIILNLPLLAAGFGIKLVFFTFRGLGREYLAGIKNGFSISRRDKKLPFSLTRLPAYARIQMELWKNLFLRFR